MSDSFDPYHKWLGIAPEEQPANHYRLLGINLFESDADVISNAADQRMAHVRSFQAGKHGAHSQQLLNQIASARVCLLDPEKKSAYDADLKVELEPEPPRPKLPTAIPLQNSAPSAREADALPTATPLGHGVPAQRANYAAPPGAVSRRPGAGTRPRRAL